MTSKKNGFLAFIFSLLPGAGEMYMGFMKKGVSTMALFFLVIALSAWSGIGPFMLILPIIWFYSFFTVHNIRSLSEEEFYMVEDNYIFILDDDKDSIQMFVKKHKNIIGVVFIILGATSLWNNTGRVFLRFLPYPIGDVLDAISTLWPQFITSISIIALGFYLIRGKKKELDLQEEIGGSANENS